MPTVLMITEAHILTIEYSVLSIMAWLMIIEMLLMLFSVYNVVQWIEYE